MADARAEAAGSLVDEVKAALEGEGDLTDADALELILAVGKRAKEAGKDDDEDEPADDAEPKDDAAPPPFGDTPPE